MKTIWILLFSILLLGCKNDTKLGTSENPSDHVPTEKLSVPQQIAHANGYKNWDKISEIAFTFNVDRGENHSERSWIWKPKSGDVILINKTDTTVYNRSKLDSLNLPADAAFINDKYWLLAPFQLVWDASSFTSTEKQNVKAPISGQNLNLLTIVYVDQGGYTPGDAYDFFYDTSYKIKEWNYRKENAEKPTLTTTWEDYKNIDPIEIATKHQDSSGNFKLYFTDISITKEGAQ